MTAELFASRAAALTPLGKGLYGAAGALLWVVLIYGVPLTLKATNAELQWQPNAQSVLGLAGLIGCYVVLGAAAAFIVEAHAAKEAVAYGLGWQSVFGEYTKKHIGDG